MIGHDLGLLCVGALTLLGVVSALAGICVVIWYIYRMSAMSLDDTTMHPWTEVQWPDDCAMAILDKCIRRAIIAMWVSGGGLLLIALMIFVADKFYGISPFFGALL